MPVTILVLGASGILGRAVYSELSNYAQANKEIEVIGTANARITHGLLPLDVMDDEEVKTFFGPRLSSSSSSFPTIIINCIAERRPDFVDAAPEKTQRLNIDYVRLLAEEAAKLPSTTLIHISTDYVFDGTSPPYKPGDQPHPLNVYGEGKLQSEEVVKAATSSYILLRIPVLYGQTKELNESPITVLVLPLLLAHDNKEAKKVDHWAARFPTYTGDVAIVLRQMVERLLDSASATELVGKTFHLSSTETNAEDEGRPFTKFSITKVSPHGGK